MEITCLLTILVCISGLFIGFILGKIAKEELKPGKKYLMILKKSLMSAVFVIAIAYIHNLIISLALGIVLVYLLLTKFKINTAVAYAGFIFIFYLTGNMLVAALILLYGFPAGSLMIKNEK